MFEHIMFPTDGSAISQAAMLTCMAFAKSEGARVTALHVLPEFHVMTASAEMIENMRAQFMIDTEERGNQVLAAVVQAAHEAGVECEAFLRRDDHPHKEILELARERGCDLIAMASHGYRGVKAMLLGSETHKVLVHSMIPVLVLRPLAP